MIVEARVVGRPHDIESRPVAVTPGSHSLRNVLRELVTEEVAAFERRQREQSLLRILTPADLVRGVETGTYAAERRAPQAAPPLDDAWRRAVEAFDDGLYYVFVDDHQIEELETVVTVGPQTRMRLVRLVALAGG
ncbi:MAG TPA: hypothetical protein VFG98_08715 [Intrasporangium sp.]|nr:hypothetical protein [Intrasporangium sp.]